MATDTRPKPTKALPWTAADDATVRALFCDTNTREIAQQIGRSLFAVKARAQHLGLIKSAGYQPAGRFMPGHTPWHAGKKRPWKTPPTQAFKAGDTSHNTLPLGTYRISTAGYLRQKISETGDQRRDWQPVHRLVWAAAHGPIQASHVVRFKQGRFSNTPEHITPDRLECLPRGEHSRENFHWHKYPREVSELIHLRGNLTKKLNKLTRDTP